MKSRNIALPVSGSMYIYASMVKRGQMFDRRACKYVLSFWGQFRTRWVLPWLIVSQRWGDGNNTKRKRSCLSIVVLHRQYRRSFYLESSGQDDCDVRSVNGGRVALHSLLSGTHGMLTFLNSPSVHVCENIVAKVLEKQVMAVHARMWGLSSYSSLSQYML